MLVFICLVYRKLNIWILIRSKLDQWMIRWLRILYFLQMQFKAINLHVITSVLRYVRTYISASVDVEGELSNEYLTFASLSLCVFMSVCKSWISTYVNMLFCKRQLVQNVIHIKQCLVNGIYIFFFMSH